MYQGPVVAIGGGTGLSTLLRGLKLYAADITAVVTVTDNGGSSGRLREELGILPPGDIRDCLVALAESEPLMADLWQYRFPSGQAQGEGVGGHSFGNLFLAALTGFLGDFEKAIAAASQVLKVRGRVLPCTLEAAVLAAELADGRVVRGETAIPAARGRVRRVWLEPDVAANPQVIAALGKAAVVVIGPGSLYTSIMPNLIAKGLAPALADTPGRVVFVTNIMTQPGETDGYTAADHLRALVEVLGPGVVDTVIVNTGIPPAFVLARYRSEGAELVAADLASFRTWPVQVIHGDYLQPAADDYRTYARHDPSRLARAVIRAARGRG